METTIKQDKTGSHKEFEKLLTKDLDNRKFKEGEITTATVSEVGKKYIFVDLKAKSEGIIPIQEFQIAKELDSLKVGSSIDVYLERIESYKTGEIVVSREKARRMTSWKKMEKAFKNQTEVEGAITSRCKGGFVLILNLVYVFCQVRRLIPSH